MELLKKLASNLGIREKQAEAAVKLIDQGFAIPFIARYRKEVTEGLSDEVLRALFDRLTYLRSLSERRETILSSIREQGKLSEELERAIRNAETLSELEDLYLPYRPKKRTRATMAREKGLEGLADLIRTQQLSKSLNDEAKQYVDLEKGVASVEEALAGASDILAEQISENAEIRKRIRELTFREGRLVSSAKDENAESVYEMYYSYEESIRKAQGHRILAINRGEKEKLLTVKVEAPVDKIISYINNYIIRTDNQEIGDFLKKMIQDSYQRLIAPSMEREVRSELTEKAEDGAIRLFGKNLTQLLMQPPLSGHTVLGWDPAFRTGCKLAVVDATGKLLDHTVIFPTPPQNRIEESERVVKKLVEKYNITLISLGNGTASRESERIISEMLKSLDHPVHLVIVNEAGASVYSASKLGSEEFPHEDVGTRSAVSMARRLQDPLAELVKIDPKSIGVGQYQHDCDQKKLETVLSGVVESCVNRVGVDLNTASPSLMSYVSGITKTVAGNIVRYREKNGAFQNRKELLKVEKLGPKAYEQCAGFMRITGGTEPLDATAVHPESYEAVRSLLSSLGIDPGEVPGGYPGISKKVKDLKGTAERLGIGEPTLRDILSELERPGRDPREEMPPPILRSGVTELSDLTPGMILKGTVRNVIDFGAFIDIGVHQDGLCHISELADHFVKHPLDVVSVGDIVEVRVLSVDEKKKRIALSMKNINKN